MNLLYVPMIDGITDKFHLDNNLSVSDYRGKPLLSVPLSGPAYAKSAIERATHASFHLREISTVELLAIFARAADIFQYEEVPVGGMPVSPDDHINYVVSSTGLPYLAVRQSMSDLANCMRTMGEVLAAQTSPGDLDWFDNKDVRPLGQNLGVVLPSNHPSVNTLWLIALATKYPIIARPSNDDVLTPYRLMRALYGAGIPSDCLFLATGDHDLGAYILNHTDRGMIFGGEDVVKSWASMSSIELHGPGKSMAYDEILTDYTFDKHIVGMMKDGGRGCINTSGVLTPIGASWRAAKQIQSRIAETPFLDPLDVRALVPAYKDKDEARGIAFLLDHIPEHARRMGSSLWRSGKQNALVESDGVTYLRPTVVTCESPQSPTTNGDPLFGLELPMQFLTVTEIDRGDLERVTQNSLITALFTHDDDFARNFQNQHNGTVYFNTATCDLDLAKVPYKIIEHLYADARGFV